MNYKKLYQYLEQHMSSYRGGTIKLWDSLDFSMYKTMKQVGYFIMSKYLSGQYDELNRLKPFRQISNGVVEIEFRAQNIDRANISYKATDGDYAFSLVVKKELQEWMENNDFGTFIDSFQKKKSQYGTSIIKITEDDELNLEVVDWMNLSVEPKNIKNGLKIEKHELSLMELEAKNGVWDDVEDVIATAKRKKYDTLNKKVEIWDVEGELAKSFFKEEAKGTAPYNVICAIVDDKKFLVHYHILPKKRFFTSRPRKAIEGRDGGVGVVEELFDPQIFTNEATMSEKFAMDIAGKVVVATNKKSSIPSALSLMDGELIEIDKNAGEYLEPVALANGVNFPEFRSQVDGWFQSMQFDQSVTDAMRGESSSAPFAAQALQSAQSSSIFNKRRDQDGFDLIDIITEYILPFIAAKIAREHELSVSLSPAEAMRLQSVIQSMNTAKLLLETPLDEAINEPIPDASRPITFTPEVKLKIPKGYLTIEKIKSKGRLYITDEMSNDQNLINSLITKLQSLSPEDPSRSEVLDQIMELSGVSPASFSQGTASEQPKPRQQTATQSVLSGALPEAQQ